MKVDIIGGGISGLSTAISLKELNPNIRVTVYEKYKTIGYNFEGRRCGEAFRIYKTINKWKPEEKSIFNNISKWEFFFGNKTQIIKLPQGTQFIIDRQNYIYRMAKKAEKLGINIIVDRKIRTIEELKGDYIVDASGCPSTIKRDIGITQKSFGITYQQTIENSNFFKKDTMIFYFTGKGYFWIFPRDPNKNEINLGIGTNENTKTNLKDLLEEFKIKKNISGKINYTLGGLVPIGIQLPLQYENIIFVGDAGIGCGVVSGAGIHRSLISGYIAAKCINNHEIKKYSKIIRKMFNKWDMIGKNYFRMNDILCKINQDLVIKIGNKAFKSINKII